MKLNVLLIALSLGLAFFLLGSFVYFLVHALPAKDHSRIIPVLLINVVCALMLMMLRRVRVKKPYFFKAANLSIDLVLIGSWAYLLIAYLSD